RRGRQLTAALRQHRPDAIPALDAALDQRKLDAGWLVAEILAGRPHAIHDRAMALELDAPLTATVIGLMLVPVLSHFQVAQRSQLPTLPWKEGYCLFCGSWPKLGEFRGLEQTRLLRCALCAAEWEFPRLRCPFCGTSDHRQLGYLHVEGEEGKY